MGISIWQIIIIAVIMMFLTRATKFPKWIILVVFAGASTSIIQFSEYHSWNISDAIISVISALSIYLAIKYYFLKWINFYTFIPFVFFIHLVRFILENIFFMIKTQELWFNYLLEELSTWESYLSLYKSPYFFETFVLILIIFYLSKITNTGYSKMKPEDVRGMIFIPRSDENIYSALEKAKFDSGQFLGDVVREISEKYNINIEFTHSLPYSGTVWLQVRTLVLENQIQRRLQVLISLTGHEFYKFPLEYTIEFKENDKVKVISGIYSLNKKEVYKILDSLVSGVPLSTIKSQIDLPRFRTSLQFWLPKNKIIRLSEPMRLANALFIIGFITVGNGIGVVLILIAIYLTISIALQKKYIITPGKPFSEPRNLKLIDSWQSVIFKLGPEFESIKKKLMSKLTGSLMKGCEIKEEKIWYWGLDGKIEKTQLVSTNNRGIAYAHIYPYGDDLYVGWDVHINYGQWIEVDVATGKDKETGKLVTLKSISPGWQSVNEYDIQDAVSLGEWCHAQLVNVVKLAMKEHEIDQEIDFQILRESRADLTNRQEPQGSKAKKSVFGGVKRIG